jgi:hypothetical protein
MRSSPPVMGHAGFTVGIDGKKDSAEARCNSTIQSNNVLPIPLNSVTSIFPDSRRYQSDRIAINIIKSPITAQNPINMNIRQY